MSLHVSCGIICCYCVQFYLQLLKSCMPSLSTRAMVFFLFFNKGSIIFMNVYFQEVLNQLFLYALAWPFHNEFNMQFHTFV